MDIAGTWTQLGIGGILSVMLFFVIRYFTKALIHKDNVNKELTEKFIKIVEQNAKDRTKIKEAINNNTKATNSNTQATRQSSDAITKLVLDVLKK